MPSPNTQPIDFEGEFKAMMIDMASHDEHLIGVCEHLINGYTERLEPWYLDEIDAFSTYSAIGDYYGNLSDDELNRAIRLCEDRVIAAAPNQFLRQLND